MSSTNGIVKGTMRVQLGSMLKLLAHSLYSRPDVCVRELLANAVDALHHKQVALNHPTDYARRHGLDEGLPRGLSPQLDIKVWYDGSGILTIEDSGTGLTQKEIEEYLTNIGVSGTKLLREQAYDPDLARRLIGQFGIGLLSCFTLADKVEVTTLSIREPAGRPGHRWTCYQDGTYEMREIEVSEPGTRVRLHITERDKRRLVEGEALANSVKLYGDLLPFPIWDNLRRPLTYQHPPWEGAAPTEEDCAKYIRHRYGWDPPLHIIPVHPVPGFEMGGVVFIPCQRGYMNRQGAVDLYVKRMLVRQDCPNVLPDDFLMLAGVVECPELTMVASREDVLRTGQFERFQRELTKQVVAGLTSLRDRPGAMRKVMASYGREIKAALLKSNELFSTLAGHLPFRDATGGPPTNLSDYVGRARERPVEAERVRIYCSQTLVGGVARFQVNQVMLSKQLEVLEAVEDLPGESLDRLIFEKYARENGLELCLAEERDDLFSPVSGWETVERLFSEIVPAVAHKRARVITSEFQPDVLPMLIFTPKHEGLRKSFERAVDHMTQLDPKMQSLMRLIRDKLQEEENMSILVLNASNREMKLLKSKIQTGIASWVAGELYHLALEYSGAVFDADSLNTVRARRQRLLGVCLRAADALQPYLEPKSADD